MRRNRQLVTLLVAAAAPLVAMTQDVYSDPLNEHVRESELQRKVAERIERGIGQPESLIADLLRAEILVESERLNRSGDVKILKQVKSLDGVALPLESGSFTGLALPAGAEQYFEVELAPVRMPGQSGSDTVPWAYLLPIPPEEVQRRRMEESGLSPEVYALMMDGMAEGLARTGIALNEGIAASGLGAILDSSDRFNASMLGGLSFDGSGGLESASPADAGMGCEALMLMGERVRDVESGRAEAGPGYARDQDALNAALFGVSSRGAAPATYMAAMGCLPRLVSTVLRNTYTPESLETVAAAVEQVLNEFAENATIGAVETVGGQRTVRLDVAGLNLAQEMDDGGDFLITSTSIWIDPDHLKRRKMRFDGTLTQDGETKPFYIEQERGDYRRVGSSYLYEPYLEIMRGGGFLDERQQAEIAEAMVELDKYEQQMAAMDPQQRAMMDRMVGPQIQALRRMVNGDGFEIRFVTHSIEINPSYYQPFTSDVMAQMAGGLGAGGGPVARELDTGGSAVLVRMVQRDLATLGYEPGPATGELNSPTAAAISRYETDRGLAVTGQVTPQLLGRLQAEVEAL